MKNLEEFFETKELVLKHSHLMREIEQLPPGAQISPSKMNEKKALEKVFQDKLHRNLIGDVLPVLPSKPTIAEILSKPKIIKKEKLISFNFDVISELNTLIDRFKIEATSKDKAWEEAREKESEYPGIVKLKIS